MAPLKTKFQQLGHRIKHKFRRHHDAAEPKPTPSSAQKPFNPSSSSPPDLHPRSPGVGLHSGPPSASTPSTSSLSHHSAAVVSSSSTITGAPTTVISNDSDSKRTSYGSGKMSLDEVNVKKAQNSTSGQTGTSPASPVDSTLNLTPKSGPVFGTSYDNPIDLTASPPPYPFGASHGAYDEMDVDSPNDSIHRAKQINLWELEDDEFERVASVRPTSVETFLTGSGISRLRRSARNKPRETQTTLQGGGNFGPPEGDEERVLHAFGRKLAKCKCAHCGRDMKIAGPEAISAVKGMVLKTSRVTGHMLCTSCERRNCVHCGSASAKSLESSLTAQSVIPVMVCCESARLYLIWAFCLGTEPTTVSAKTKASSQKTKSSSSKPKPTPTATAPLGPSTDKKAVAKSSPLGVHYMPSGVGYGGGSNWDIALPQALKSKSSRSKIAVPSTQEEDKLLEAYFRILADLLPHPEGGSKFDDGPTCGKLLRYIFFRSPLMRRAAELLRNTAIDDIAKRHSLYRGLATLLSTLSGHHSTVPIVDGAVTLYPVSEQLMALTIDPPRARGTPSSYLVGAESNGKTKPKTYDTTDCLANIVSRSGNLYNGILRQAAIHEADFRTQDGQDMLLVCRIYADLIDFLVNNGIVARDQQTQVTRKDPSSNAGPSPEAKRAALTAWHQENCVSEILDEQLLKNFYFAKDAGQVKNPAMGRMKKLIMEINIMRASLPLGIYIRHGTSRLDIMKAIVIGPKGTPYEGGVFEFDMFCPAKFPASPPLMRLKTTGGGAVRFNPNLYADGNVCLSVINTWGQGQSWDPARSTLLQVLLSIQSMIFCAHPWYNEPGRELQPNDSASETENRTLQGHSIEHAMLYWLNKLPTAERQGVPDVDMYIWQEVVSMHFMSEGQGILDTVAKWKGKRMLKELGAAMQKHGFLSG